MLDNTYASFSPVTVRWGTTASTGNGIDLNGLRNPTSLTYSTTLANTALSLHFLTYFRISLHGRAFPDRITFNGHKTSDGGTTSVYIWINNTWIFLDFITEDEPTIHIWNLTLDQIANANHNEVYIAFRHVGIVNDFDSRSGLMLVITNSSPFTISKITNTANTSPNTYPLVNPNPFWISTRFDSLSSVDAVNPNHIVYSNFGGINPNGGTSGIFTGTTGLRGILIHKLPLFGRAIPDRIIFRGGKRNATSPPLDVYIWINSKWEFLQTIDSHLFTNITWNLTPEQVNGIPDELGFIYFAIRWTPLDGVSAANTGISYDGSNTFRIEKTVDTSLSTPEIISESLQIGAIENEYRSSILAIGARPIEYSVVQGRLPSGIKLSSDGVLSGVPIETGDFAFTIRAINIHGFDEREFTLTIIDIPITHLSPRNLPSAIVGNEYEVQFEASGESGLLSATYNLQSENLPNGLSLTSCGRITGAPLNGGTFFFVVRVENSHGYVDFTRSITVQKPPNITTNSIANGTIDRPFRQNINISGTTPVSLSIEDGELPQGLSLRAISDNDTERHQVYGTPIEKGNFRFTLKAANSVGSATKEFSMNVVSTPQINADYFRKINNTYQSSSRQETDLQIANRHFDDRFADSISFHVVERNGKPLEALIERNTDRNNHIKSIKTRNRDKINVGDYINWDGHIWLIMGIDPDNKLHNHGIMFLCNLKLRWQNQSGDIIERWGYTEDFTKYSRGINERHTMTTGDYQYGITFPVDDETKILKRERRFAIDFEGIYPPDVYRVTNRKIYQNDNRYFDRGGILTLALSFDFFNPERDKLVKLPSGEEVWICGLHSPTESQESPESESDNVVETNNPFENWWKQGGDNN